MDVFKTLELPTTATLAEIKARWRVLAAEHHPDRGGDADVFHTIRQAYQEALRIAQTPTRCERCRGTGKIAIGHGFHTIKIRCSQCHGMGGVKRERHD